MEFEKFLTEGSSKKLFELIKSSKEQFETKEEFLGAMEEMSNKFPKVDVLDQEDIENLHNRFYEFIQDEVDELDPTTETVYFEMKELEKSLYFGDVIEDVELASIELIQYLIFVGDVTCNTLDKYFKDDLTKWLRKEFEVNYFEIKDFFEQLENVLTWNRKTGYGLTQNGHATVSYLKFEKLSSELDNQLEMMKKNNKKVKNKHKALKTTIVESKSSIDALSLKYNKEVEEITTEIENFNNNIISIMGIMVTAFSIIGFNIYSLENQFTIPRMVVANTSLAFTLAIAFNMLDHVIFKRKSTMIGIVAFIIGLLLMIEISAFTSRGWL